MNISLVCPINLLSYGIVSVNILNELTLLGHNVALFPIGRSETYPRFEQSVRTALANAEKFDVNAVCIRLFHQFDLALFVGRGPHIGFPIFELDTFTAKERHHLNSCDKLFVCSQWASDIVEENLKDWNRYPNTNICEDTHIIPLGVDSSIFTPKKSGRKPTIFLNVGKWEKRKGHDILGELFSEAFTSDDNVELWMMCHNPFLKPESQERWESLYRSSKLGEKIRILPRVESDEQVANIMQQADCGMFPSRGEGWNLPAMEMLSCGKDIIITSYSAHTEFCTKENATLVPISGLEPARDGIWFFGQGNWAALDKVAERRIIRGMREVHQRKQSGQLALNEAGIETAKKFSWRNTAETIIRNLE